MAAVVVASRCSVPARASGQLVRPARPRSAGASGDGLRGGGPDKGPADRRSAWRGRALRPGLRASSPGRWLLGHCRRGASVGPAVAMAVHEALPTCVTLDEQLPVMDGAMVRAAQDDEVAQGVVATA